MDEVKGIRIVSLTGEKEYGIEDSEVREELANVVDGAPEELDSFKEAFEKFKEGGEALATITESVERNAEAITAETERAEQAEQTLDRKITDEIDKIKNGDTIAAQAREIHSRNGKTVTDSFLARTTAGSGTIGDGVASLKSVGGNIVKTLVDGSFETWIIGAATSNIVDKGVVSLYNDTSASLQVRTEKINLISNHKYYFSTFVKSDADVMCSFNSLNVNVVKTTIHNKWHFVSIAASHTKDEYKLTMIRSVNCTYLQATKPLLIDLTEMFGAGKEPDKATCDKLFGTMDALPQGLNIANPSEFKSTGFNQFNPNNVLEGKAIVDNAIVSGDKKIAVIPCLPCKVGTGENNGYCIHGDFGEDIKVYLTPLNPMEVDGELYMHELTKDATTDTYVPLIKGYLLVEVPTTANLCAHFLWSEDKCERDSYEPYFESKVKMPNIPQMSEWGLAGIQSSGTLAADTIDLDRMIYTNRIGCVDMGSLIWTYYNNKYFYSNNLHRCKKGGSVICDKYSTNGIGTLDKNIPNKSIIISNSNGVVIVNDTSYTDAASLKASLQGVMLYYELAEPEEYPLPKVDNNYISSDYGVEQFDSSIPCNANNLYYMRSLAGEARNFLDRMYDNTAKADAKEVADYITNGIEGNKELATNAPNLALRTLFVGAGAEYNDTDGVKQVNLEFDKDLGGTIVQHLPHHYRLNSLGDITEEEMIKIYNIGKFTKTEYGPLAAITSVRTNLGRRGPANASAGETPYTAYLSTGLVTINLCVTSAYEGIFLVSSNAFNGCANLHAIYGRLTFDAASTTAFAGCTALERIKIYGLKVNVILADSPLISKRSVLYMIQNAKPTTAITITLHPNAYARLAEDADIVAALAAQPLITLVSA